LRPGTGSPDRRAAGIFRSVCRAAEKPPGVPRPVWGTRPAWYFEPGMHGGTLNDIAIHALDFIPWVA